MNLFINGVGASLLLEDSLMVLRLKGEGYEKRVRF